MLKELAGLSGQDSGTNVTHLVAAEQRRVKCFNRYLFRDRSTAEDPGLVHYPERKYNFRTKQTGLWFYAELVQISPGTTAPPHLCINSNGSQRTVRMSPRLGC